MPDEERANRSELLAVERLVAWASMLVTELKQRL